MAVSSCRMRKEVTCDRGALASAEVYLWRKRGRRRFRRVMRDWGVDAGGGVVYGRVMRGSGGGGGHGRVRRSVRRNIVEEVYLTLAVSLILQSRPSL
jgi:hypothetical protein